MFLELTEEQKMIVETIRKFKEKECPREKVREWDETETFPSHIWKRLGEIGILGAAFPEQYGGTGGGIIEEMLITEELSYRFSDIGLTYLLGVCFGGISILEQGNDEQKDKYLPPLISGDTNFCLSLTEPGGGTDILGALKSRAKQDGDYFILNGTKIFTTGEAFAAAEFGYQAGKFGLLELLGAQRALFEARQRQLDAQAAAHLAAIELQRLLGREPTAVATNQPSSL